MSSPSRGETRRRRRAPTSDEPARQHQPQHVAALRAERDADADFPCPLRDAVRYDAVESDRGEKHGDGGEHRQQAHDEESLRRATSDDQRRERRDVVNRDRRIQLAQRRAAGAASVEASGVDDFRTATRYESVICACGMYIAGVGGAVRSSWWTSADDADDGRHGPCAASPIRTCDPIGFSRPIPRWPSIRRSPSPAAPAVARRR